MHTFTIVLYHTGLYRVNYDEENWRLITAALNSPQYEKIDPLNRVQLLADALDLAWRGDVPYPLAIGLLGYLQRETAYLPWRAGLSRLNSLDRLMQRTPKNGEFRVSTSSVLLTL